MYWLNLSGRESLCLQSALWIMMYLRACLENSFLDMEQARFYRNHILRSTILILRVMCNIMPVDAYIFTSQSGKNAKSACKDRKYAIPVLELLHSRM